MPRPPFLSAWKTSSAFALFFLLGWVYRRDLEAHQRLMLLAVIIGLLGAPMGRMVG